MNYDAAADTLDLRAHIDSTLANLTDREKLAALDYLLPPLEILRHELLQICFPFSNVVAESEDAHG